MYALSVGFAGLEKISSAFCWQAYLSISFEINSDPFLSGFFWGGTP